MGGLFAELLDERMIDAAVNTLTDRSKDGAIASAAAEPAHQKFRAGKISRRSVPVPAHQAAQPATNSPLTSISMVQIRMEASFRKWVARSCAKSHPTSKPD